MQDYLSLFQLGLSYWLHWFWDKSLVAVALKLFPNELSLFSSLQKIDCIWNLRKIFLLPVIMPFLLSCAIHIILFCASLHSISKAQNYLEMDWYSLEMVRTLPASCQVKICVRGSCCMQPVVYSGTSVVCSVIVSLEQAFNVCACSPLLEHCFCWQHCIFFSSGQAFTY